MDQQSSHVRAVREKLEAQQAGDGKSKHRTAALEQDSNAIGRREILGRRQGPRKVVATEMHCLPTMTGREENINAAYGSSTAETTPCGVHTRRQWPDGIKMQEGNSGYSVITSHMVFGSEEQSERMRMESSVHYADASLLDRDWESRDRRRLSTGSGVSRLNVVEEKRKLRSKSESGGHRYGGERRKKPELPPKPKCVVPPKPHVKPLAHQPLQRHNLSSGLVTTATGGILRDHSPDPDLPPKPHRRTSLIETIKRWNGIVSDKGMADHIRRQSGAKDYVLYRLETKQSHDSSSVKKSVLWKRNRSGVWEEWLVMYQNECLQFYDLKDTAMTSPCAQVSFKSVDSVHDIDDQQSGNTTFRHCFIVETPQHSYQFSAQSSGEQRSWVAILRSEIMRFKTQSALYEDKVTGNSQITSRDSQLKAATVSNGCRSSPEPSLAVKGQSAAATMGNSVSSESPPEAMTSTSFLSKVVHEGCLWKQEKKSPRWKYWKFILTDESLLCFKSYKRVRNGDRPLATIPVSLITGVTGVSVADTNDFAKDRSKRGYPFEVVTSNGRRYLLAASSADVCDVWVAAINRIVMVQ